ncbi:ciliary microtubule-associated protein 3 [Gastrophryne carolinensis]
MAMFSTRAWHREENRRGNVQHQGLAQRRDQMWQCSAPGLGTEKRSDMAMFNTRAWQREKISHGNVQHQGLAQRREQTWQCSAPGLGTEEWSDVEMFCTRAWHREDIRHGLAETSKKVCFGSTQDRKHFPYDCAPDRLGNELAPIRGAPNRGPGCYNYEEVTNNIHLQDRKPMSKKGYILGARTAQRFPSYIKMETPSPAEYQSFWAKERSFSASYTPFNIQARRFPDKITAISLNPSPGAYEHDIKLGRKVSWPGRFGSPDWSSVPTLQKKTLRSELSTDKEFRKNRNRVAYLSLYYS